MSHLLIVGTTESGKSTLAKKYAQVALNKGKAVIVYDPLGYDWGDGALVFSDAGDFFRGLSTLNDGALVIMDEGDTLQGMNNRQNWWLMLRGRHYGFKCILITQRPALVSPTVRGMCTTCAVFLTSKKDAKLLGEDYAVNLDLAPELKQGQYLDVSWKDGKRVVDKRKVF